MKFCPVCESVMRCEAASGAVMFVCGVCGTTAAGAAGDARVGGERYTADQTAQLNDRLIRSAPHDPTTQTVATPCPKCGLPYMAQLLLGDDMIPVTSCKCGYVVYGAV